MVLLFNLVISTNNPSLYYPIHPPTALSDSLHDPTFNMLVFKTTSALLPPANRQSPHHLLVHENLHVLSLPIYTIAEDYVSPYVLREIQLFLLIVLNESRLLYTANSFEYPPVSKSTSRHLLDSAYDNHLTLFYRYSIGPTIRQVDMEYTAITTKSSILKKRLSALFSRYGELCDWDVDMQTEIALLKNNITIHCETSNSTRNSRLNELVDKVLKGQVEVYTPLVPRASFLNFVTALEKRPIIYLNEAANVDHGIGTLVKKKVVLKKKEDGISKDVKKKK